MRGIVLVALMLAGCGGTPYFDVGVGYQIDDHSDWHVRTERDWQCSDNFQAQFTLGLDYGDWEVGYQHQSWYTCGGPFNDRPELYEDSIQLKYRIALKDEN